MSDRHDGSMVPVVVNAGLCTQSSRVTVSTIRQRQNEDADYIPHLTRGDVQLMAVYAKKNERHGWRNAVLIRVVYDAALRIGEALAIRRDDLEDTPDGWLIHIHTDSKTGAGVAAISTPTANELLAYWGESKRPRNVPIFGISRSQAYRIIVDAYQGAGVRRPSVAVDGTGAVHILRHTGALERLNLTGNPRALQDQLRHRSAKMTLRYLRTQTKDQSMTIQQSVNPTW